MFKHRYPILGMALVINCLGSAIPVHAESASAVDELQPSVAQRLVLMDKDRDGIVNVHEVRAYIESVHGKGYQQDVLDRMEALASGQSCSTPFAQSLYQ